MNSLDPPAVIISNGSCFVQCGLSGDEHPRTFPSIHGSPKNPGIMVGMGYFGPFVGDEAEAKRGILTVKRAIPIDGSPLNFNILERIWHHTFYNECRVTPEEHNVVMTEFKGVDDKKREKIISIMFETFNIPNFQLMNSSVLSVFSSGSDTGVVVDCGYGGNRIVPVFEGYPIPNASLEMTNPQNDFKDGPNIGGFVLSRYLVELLKEQGYEMTTSAERAIVADIKEKLGYVSLDYDSDIMNEKKNTTTNKKYELPDGEMMTISNECCFQVCEPLFNPSLINRKIPGIHHFINQSILRCDKTMKFDKMWENIVLCGGTSCFPGFEERLRLELSKLGRRSSNHITFNESTSEYRKYSSFFGGSAFLSAYNNNNSSHDSSQSSWIKRDYYDEVGSSVVLRKCLRVLDFPKTTEIFLTDSFDRDLKDRMEYMLSYFEEEEEEENVEEAKRMKKYGIKIHLENLTVSIPTKILIYV